MVKTPYRQISEVAQPRAEDEINFKQKHVIDHILEPNAEESQFTADAIKKFINRSDYKNGEDIAVYEQHFMTHDAYGNEDADIDNDGDADMTDHQLRYRRKAHIKHKIVDEACSSSFMRARKKAITKKLQQEGLLDVIEPVGGEYGDEEESHVSYKKKNQTSPDHTGEPLTEVSKEKLGRYIRSAIRSKQYDDNASHQLDKSIDMHVAAGHDRAADVLKTHQKKYKDRADRRAKGIDQALDKLINERFKVGRIRLKSGETVTLSDKDVKALNKVYSGLSENNQTQFEKNLLESSYQFSSMMVFVEDCLNG